MDVNFMMGDETVSIRKKKTQPERHAVLTSRAFYAVAGFIQQFKSQVLSLLGQFAVAIYHATQTHLESWDTLQRNFVSLRCQKQKRSSNTNWHRHLFSPRGVTAHTKN